jgi:hypothetical protein
MAIRVNSLMSDIIIPKLRTKLNRFGLENGRYYLSDPDLSDQLFAVIRRSEDIGDSDESIYSFELEDLRFCCGIYEIGNIRFYGEDRDNRSKDFQNVLDNTVRALILHNRTDRKNYTYIANLIDTEECDIIRKAFIRTQLFSLVKRFKNPNSNNYIEIWMSVH